MRIPKALHGWTRGREEEVERTEGREVRRRKERKEESSDEEEEEVI